MAFNTEVFSLQPWRSHPKRIKPSLRLVVSAPARGANANPAPIDCPGPAEGGIGPEGKPALYWFQHAGGGRPRAVTIK